MNVTLAVILAFTLQSLVLIALLGWVILTEQRARAAASDKWAAILNELSAQQALQLQEVADRYLRAFSPNPVGPAPDAILIPREPDGED